MNQIPTESQTNVQPAPPQAPHAKKPFSAWLVGAALLGTLFSQGVVLVGVFIGAYNDSGLATTSTLGVTIIIAGAALWLAFMVWGAIMLLINRTRLLPSGILKTFPKRRQANTFFLLGALAYLLSVLIPVIMQLVMARMSGPIGSISTNHDSILLSNISTLASSLMNFAAIGFTAAAVILHNSRILPPPPVQPRQG